MSEEAASLNERHAKIEFNVGHEIEGQVNNKRVTDLEHDPLLHHGIFNQVLLN